MVLCKTASATRQSSGKLTSHSGRCYTSICLKNYTDIHLAQEDCAKRQIFGKRSEHSFEPKIVLLRLHWILLRYNLLLYMQASKAAGERSDLSATLSQTKDALQKASASAKVNKLSVWIIVGLNLTLWGGGGSWFGCLMLSVANSRWCCESKHFGSTTSLIMSTKFPCAAVSGSKIVRILWGVISKGWWIHEWIFQVYFIYSSKTA